MFFVVCLLALTLRNADGQLSLNGIREWIGTNEGPCIPQGSLLVEEGDPAVTVAKVRFQGPQQWFVAPTWLGNAFNTPQDLSATPGFTIEYTATADFWIQMRSASVWSGGAKWATKLVAGQRVTKTISWTDSSAWSEPLGASSQTLAQVLGETQGLVMIGNVNNDITVYSLIIPGWTPGVEVNPTQEVEVIPTQGVEDNPTQGVSPEVDSSSKEWGDWPTMGVSSSKEWGDWPTMGVTPDSSSARLSELPFGYISLLIAAMILA